MSPINRDEYFTDLELERFLSEEDNKNILDQSCGQKDCEHYNQKTNRMKKWINVKDEKPKQYTPLLVCNMEGQTVDEREPEKAYYEDGKFISLNPENYDIWCYLKVTHWMPLPPLPRRYER